MICVHCGKEIDNGQAFCPYCGSRVGGDAAPEAKAAKKDPRKLALPVAAVALLAVVGVGLANRMPSIDLQRYVTITAQGYDTLGKLDVSFDTDKLEADYGKRIADSFKKAMNDHKESTYGLSSLAADLYSGSETELFVDYCATGSADKTSGLRNGDVITYSWNESEDEAETLFGVKVKYSDITYTVSGLEKVNTFDAFDGVTVEFNGTAPQGTATVNSLPTAEAGGSLHYTLDTTDGLRNGDTVTLTASSNREDFSDCIEKYGAIPAETEKTFTVSGLNEYVTTPALLTDTVLDSLKAQAEDTFKAYAANHWDTDSESLIGMDYVGDYILTPKEDSFWVDNDIVTLVYKINVHNRYQNFNDEVYEGDNSYYWYISFKIDRCAHDLKTHRYKPLLAPGIALTLIYLYLEYLSLDPYFWLTRVFRFVYNPLSWICFFLFAGLLVLDAVHAANTYKQYRHLENTIGAAVYFYLFKMARVPGKIGFAVGLMLIMDIFGNYPYLFPIMVTGWLAMQACSKMVTGSADLKY